MVDATLSQQLSFALNSPSLLTGVFVPVVILVAGMLARAGAFRRFLLFGLISLALVPLCFMTSWWEVNPADGGGLHIMPMYVLAGLYFAVRGKLDARRDALPLWGAFWIAALLVDTSGAYLELAPTSPAWWWAGIGGDGLTDGLVTLPVIMTALVFSVQRLIPNGKTVPMGQASVAG